MQEQQRTQARDLFVEHVLEQVRYEGLSLLDAVASVPARLLANLTAHDIEPLNDAIRVRVSTRHVSSQKKIDDLLAAVRKRCIRLIHSHPVHGCVLCS